MYSVFVIVLLISLFSFKPKPKENSTQFPHPDWSKNATIYEVNIRQFTPEGTFKAFEDHLPRLQQMGIKILWLMPVQPIGLEKRKGSLGSPYSIRDYYGINPEYGTREDFKHLVARAHELGMYVIIDWVANHTSWDNDLITAHPEWYKKDSLGNIISPIADWSDVAGLDYSQQELWGYMRDALLYWIKECDIDGYRCDVAGMIPVEFWNSTIPEIKKIKHIFMLAEWETPNMHDTAFDATYSWDFYNLMNQIAKGEKLADDIDTLFEKELQTYPPHAFRMRFTSNHDENSWNGTEFERLGEASEAFAVLTFTFPGIPLIYTGQESAMNKRLSFFDKDTVPWQDYRLESFYTALINLKLNYTVLDAGENGGAYQRVPSSNEKAVFVFIRKNTENKLLVVLNLSSENQEVELTGNDFPGNYKEVFTGIMQIFNKGERITLDPWEYKLYTMPI